MLSNFHTTAGLASCASPGARNDPGMLEIGNGMSATENQSEFSLWAGMAVPLIEGSNLVTASSATLSILASKAVIAVDQDPLGEQGTEVSSAGSLDVLARPLANGDVSVALFNETGSAATISTTAAAIGKSGASSYTLTDLWAGARRARFEYHGGHPGRHLVLQRPIQPAMEPRIRKGRHAHDRPVTTSVPEARITAPGRGPGSRGWRPGRRKRAAGGGGVAAV